MIKTDFTHLFQTRFWFWTPSAGCEGPEAWEVRQGLRVGIGIQSLCCAEALKAVKLLQGQMQTRRGERSEGCVGNTHRNLKLFPPLGESVVSLRSASSRRRIVSSLEKRPHTRNKNLVLLIFRSLLFRRGCCWEADRRYGKCQPRRVGNASVRLNRRWSAPAQWKIQPSQPSFNSGETAAFRQQRSTSQNG